MLRFDVGKQRYTTVTDEVSEVSELRFDVGKQRYTTPLEQRVKGRGCGLM